MRRPLFIFLLVLAVLPLAAQKKTRGYKIQIALLLDVSGSMNGLLNQAKGQIWRLVNQLEKTEKDGKKPVIELAIISYGNSTFGHNGFVQLHCPLTSDFDLVSENLFKLYTSGDSEYCGYAIQYALDNLAWAKGKENLRMIIIAGNEAFNQGVTDYSLACKNALKSGVVINTVYCGEKNEGIRNLWEEAATRAGGKFAVLDAFASIYDPETLWDKKLFDFNRKLNESYLPFGPEGQSMHAKLVMLDDSAAEIGKYSLRERAYYKAKDNYLNQEWDLVDAYQADITVLSRLTAQNIDARIRNMTLPDLKEHLEQKTIERQIYKEGIRQYYFRAIEFLREAAVQDGALTLEETILGIVEEQATAKGYVFYDDEP